MIKRGFEVCGVTSTDAERVRNDTFYKSVMAKVQEEMKDYDNELLDDDPFEFESDYSLSILEYFFFFSFFYLVR